MAPLPHLFDRRVLGNLTLESLSIEMGLTIKIESG